MSLGKPGGNQPGQPADPGSFYQPNDVITYPNGDILVAEGHGTKEIATILNVSVKTVEFHKSRIMQHLDIHTTADLTKYAITHGITGL